MDDLAFFEQHVSKKAKRALIKAMGGESLLRQQDMHAELVKAGLQQRIEAAKRECQERRQRREAAANYQAAAQKKPGWESPF